MQTEAEQKEAVTAAAFKSRLRNKLKKTRFQQQFDSLVNLGSKPSTSDSLASLKNALQVNIALQQVEDNDCEFARLYTHIITHDITGAHFMELNVDGGTFYSRQCDPGLYAAVGRVWKAGFNRVAVIGNEGGGKLWFQMYCLRQLLQDAGKEGGTKYVVCQVGTKLYIYDLVECEAMKWQINMKDHGMELKEIMDDMEETVYFLEPGDTDEKPLHLNATPSLSTLSPFEPFYHHIKEYSKVNYKELYFPTWRLSELIAVGKDEDTVHTEDLIKERYHKFGGIIHHIMALPGSTVADDELNFWLQNLNINLLHRKAVAIERRAGGENVSRYLLRYSDIPEEGEDSFATKGLAFTSALVEHHIHTQLITYTLKANVQAMLDHLSHKVVDRSGLHLENVTAELLARGQDIAWQYAIVNDVAGTKATWKKYTTKKRKIEKVSGYFEDKIAEANKIFQSSDEQLPSADIILSAPVSTKAEVDAVQTTWQEAHPFSLRALYDLRVKRMQIEETCQLNLYFAVPNWSEEYLTRIRSKFLAKGSTVANPLQWTTKETVSAAYLRTMWANTTLHVLRPKDGWKHAVASLAEKSP
eukprot:scaffold212763_cov51-Attheya_sp.AAC.1